ncbi:DMT family transporter [Nocardia brevicatena]|uniref:DMT family transporter n=1 Tax=Nocardia brevicatena TaxID=37327 RepID=UPI000592AF84|nr:SMR family transporter [Nocardia brevicatena]
MNPTWPAIIVAGLLEITWAHGIRLADGITKLVPTVVCGLLAVAVVFVLNLGVRTLPIETAYAVFVRIGATGTALVDMIWLREPVGLTRVIALALIIGGVVWLQLTEQTGESARGN